MMTPIIAAWRFVLTASKLSRWAGSCIVVLAIALGGLGADWPARTAGVATGAPKGGTRAFTRTIEPVDIAAETPTESEEVDDVAAYETKWISTGSRTWATNSNWSNDHPTTGKAAVFEGTSLVSVSGSDESAGGTVPRLRIYREYTGSIGNSGTPLILPLTDLNHRGLCSVYIQQSLISGGNVFLNSPQIDPPALTWTGYNPTYINMLNGGMIYNATSDTTGGTYLSVTGGTLTIPVGTILLTRIFQSSGTINLYGTATEVVMAGTATFTTEGTGCVDKLRIFGGLFTANGLPSSSVIEIFGGVVDYRNAINFAYSPTVMIYPGGDFWASKETMALCTIRDFRNDFP